MASKCHKKTPKHQSMYAHLNKKLREFANKSPEPPYWYDDWSQLGHRSSLEQRLDVYRDIRDSGDVPDEAGFYLIASVICNMTRDRYKQRFTEIDKELHSIFGKLVFAEEAEVEVNESEVYRQHLKTVSDEWDWRYITEMTDLGEYDMADLLRCHPVKFEAKAKDGRWFFDHPHLLWDDLGWSFLLDDSAIACMEPCSTTGDLSIRYRPDMAFWIVRTNLAQFQVSGGSHDGTRLLSFSSIIVNNLLPLFDSVAECVGTLAERHDSAQPQLCLMMRGIFKTRAVCLTVMGTSSADEPDDEPHVSKVEARDLGL